MFSRDTKKLVIRGTILALGLFAALLMQPAVHTQAAAPGAPIVIGGDVTNVIDVFDFSGVLLDNFDGDFTIADGLAVGDVNGDGVDEILVAGDVTGVIDIFDLSGIPLNSFDGDYTIGDGFAVGDVSGDGVAEILVAGDFTGTIDIFNMAGTKLGSFDGDMTIGDGFAVGDVNGDGSEEILVAGDFTGTIDIFNMAGTKLGSFDGDMTPSDGFAVGDVNGDGFDEILVAGDFTGTIDIFNQAGTKLTSFDGDYTISDGFAVGDVNGDGVEDILVAGDVTGVIDIFNMAGTKLTSFDGNYTIADGFAVGTVQYPDQDGDGLLDHWETNGLDVDNDGTIDVDLPAMGVSPQHMDLLLELDIVAGQAPRRQDIQAMKIAFAAAPITNPDGINGINLLVDTGALVDPAAREGVPLGTCLDGADNGLDGVSDANDPDCQNIAGSRNFIETATEDPLPGNCTDGVDNNGDGLADAADPTCLVGDNLGGGNTVASPIGCLDGNFYNTKSANFAANRRLVFRYAISGDPNDSSPCGGGRGEIGGNDFIEYNHDAGTIMHELGHNLNLHHGGDVDNNCKPNFVSVMNYDLQFGIPQIGGGAIIDYSGPRFPGGRSIAPLATLNEASLDESIVFDPADTSNRFIFVNALGMKTQSPLNGDVNGDGIADGVDWNGDGLFTGTGLSVNIDTVGTNGRPSACQNNSSSSVLTGHNDWTRVSVPFRQFGDSDDSAINPVLDPEPTLIDREDMWDEINTTDLAITKSDSVDPVAAGEQLVYTLDVVNNGPNPASAVQVIDTLPTGVTYVSDNAGCVEAPVGTLTCDLGEVLPYTSQAVEITVLVAADLVYNAGGPLTITNTATVTNLAGPDLDTSDNTALEDTLVVAVADLAIVDFAIENPPADVLIGEPVEIVLNKTITNYGPSAPMDVTITRTASAEPGATVSPAHDVFEELALGLNEMRLVEEVFTISCEAPGDHTFTFTNEIAPSRPEDTDPDLSNNYAEVTLTVDCVVPVAINIRPHGFPNSVNLRSIISLAVLTTEAGEYDLPLSFDATTIDPLLVVLGTYDLVWFELGGATEVHDQGHIEDSYELDESTRDGDLDMVLHFLAELTGIQLETTELCVKGTFYDSGSAYMFFGCDTVRFVPPK